MLQQSINLEYKPGKGLPFYLDLDQLKTSTRFKEIVKTKIQTNINEKVAKINHSLLFIVMVPITGVSLILVGVVNALAFPFGFVFFGVIVLAVVIFVIWFSVNDSKARRLVDTTIFEISKETHGCIRAIDKLEKAYLTSSNSKNRRSNTPVLQLYTPVDVNIMYATKHQDLEILQMYGIAPKKR